MPVIFKCHLNIIPKHACPEAKRSNPTSGLTLLWARNPFRESSNCWQVSQEEAGRIKSKLLFQIFEELKYYVAFLVQNTWTIVLEGQQIRLEFFGFQHEQFILKSSYLPEQTLCRSAYRQF
jgi:hypothetical protein